MLAAAQMLGSSGLTVVVILGGIVAAQMAPRPSLATVPISLAIVATALTTIPASLLMRRIGRRAGSSSARPSAWSAAWLRPRG